MRIQAKTGEYDGGEGRRVHLPDYSVVLTVLTWEEFLMTECVDHNANRAGRRGGWGSLELAQKP